MLTNNDILKKLRVALQLRDEDIIEILGHVSPTYIFSPITIHSGLLLADFNCLTVHIFVFKSKMSIVLVELSFRSLPAIKNNLLFT